MCGVESFNLFHKKGVYIQYYYCTVIELFCAVLKIKESIYINAQSKHIGASSS